MDKKKKIEFLKWEREHSHKSYDDEFLGDDGRKKEISSLSIQKVKIN